MIEEIQARHIPTILEENQTRKKWEEKRNKIKLLLQQYEYGSIPKEHVPITSQILTQKRDYFGGKAVYQKVELTMNFETGKFSFPIQVMFPKKKKELPCFLYIDFYQEIANHQVPLEEICDQGYALVSFCYQNITSDNQDFSDGLSKFFYKGEPRMFGKIGLWAYAAMHVMDYLGTRTEFDQNHIAIIGLSRLGKTALVTGAFDDRFRYVISTDSGQSGASLSRGKKGEKIRDICSRFPYWFCSHYQTFIDKEEDMPFDQHYLLALIAPRYLYVASASEDEWADSESEFLACIATNPVYHIYHKDGLEMINYPEPNTSFHQGNIGYHLRRGTHDLCRYDWNQFIQFIEKKKASK